MIYLIEENKIIIYDSDHLLSDKNDLIIASYIKENNKAIEDLIIKKNSDAVNIIHKMHEQAMIQYFMNLEIYLKVN